MTRRRLTELRIDKVAAVDRPCQEHASADIMKRAEDEFDDSEYLSIGKRTFTAEERRHATSTGAAMPGGRYPIENVEDLHNAIRAVGRGKGSHAAIRAHIISRAKSLGATDQLPEDWSTSKKESPMLNELAKALGLPETATEADITKAVTDNITKSASRLDAIIKMSAKHKAYMDHPDATMPKGGKEAFADMSPSERDDHCDAHPLDEDDGDEEKVRKALRAGDAFRTPEGIVITKRKLGDELFAVLKGQNEALIKAKKDAEDAKEEKAEEDMAKRADTLGFGSEFGPTLRKAYGGDAAAQTEVEKRIKGLQEQVAAGHLFKNFGRPSPTEGSAEGELMAKVAEVQKNNPKLKPAQAYTKAYTDPANADIVKRMKAEAEA